MSELTINEFAKMGGNARFNQIGVEGMKEMSKKAVEAKRKKKEQKLQESSN